MVIHFVDWVDCVDFVHCLDFVGCRLYIVGGTLLVRSIESYICHLRNEEIAGRFQNQTKPPICRFSTAKISFESHPNQRILTGLHTELD